MTSATSSSLDEVKIKHRSVLIGGSAGSVTLENSMEMALDGPRMEISRPLNVEDETMSSSYPSRLQGRISMSPYAPQADFSECSPCNTCVSKEGEESERHSEACPQRTDNKSDSYEDSLSGSFDMKESIRSYVDNVRSALCVKYSCFFPVCFITGSSLQPHYLLISHQTLYLQAFNTPRHPLGVLMNRLETVFKESYGGVGANKYLLSHAIAEVHSIIQRMHSIVRCVHVPNLEVEPS